MTKHSQPAPIESADVVKLARVVEELKHQVRELALIMDEIREDLLGAVRNTGLDPRMTRRMVEDLLSDDDEDFDYDEESDDESPVPPPRVRATEEERSESQPSLFS